METKTATGTVSTFAGKALNPAINFTYDYVVYDNVVEMQNAKVWPSEKEIFDWQNKKAETAAKAKASMAATEKLREAYEATPEFKLESLVKQILKSNPKLSQAAAEAFATSMLQAEG